MATNCLSPAYAQVNYSSNGHPHVMRLGLNNADADVTNVTNKGGASVDADSSLATFLNLLTPYFYPTGGFAGVEYFTQADCLSAPVFQRAYDLGGGIPGTGIGSDEPYMQLAFTFKTTFGGRFKLLLMEPGGVPDVKDPLSTISSAAAQAIRDYLLSSGDVVAAYDNGYPALPLNFITKTNDALRKKYLHP